ncbi:MAG: guanine deaminase [Pontibacterium sp.]
MQHPLNQPLENEAVSYLPQGAVYIEQGKVKWCGQRDWLSEQMPEALADDVEVCDHQTQLILPGFVDCHIHYPQTEMIAAYGNQLLEWLETYTFPTEQKFADPAHATAIAQRFLHELLRNGTTTALVFGSVHKTSVDCFFEQALALNLRMLCGKVMMDRHAPDALTDTPESSYADSKALIERWHEKGRLHYAVTPRFAPTSTPEQLAMAARLLKEYPSTYLHTHLSENLNEIDWVLSLFPEAKHYLDVYDQAGLVKERSVFAHGIHLCDDECQRLGEADASVAHCPTSNLFLGSGLFPLSTLEKAGVTVGMGTDVGAGTSFSMLQTLGEGYKVQQLRGERLSPFKALYLATLGGAKALKLEQAIGQIAKGYEADLVVLDVAGTDFMAFRDGFNQTLMERLFVLNTLGDDRAVAATYIMGEVYKGEA